jgi:hypothetical protein
MRRGPDCNRHSRICADAPLHVPGYPGGIISDGHRDCVFGGMTELSVRCGPNQKPNPGNGTNRLPTVGPATQVKERVGRTTPFSSSAMSSGRLFLDRVGRHQSPSPLHRRDQNNRLPDPRETIYHRTVSSVLTGCLTFRDKRRSTLHNLRLQGHPEELSQPWFRPLRQVFARLSFRYRIWRQTPHLKIL